ncbi:hypothetical protein [Geothrix limicola]|uniref:hypothetical protein n=1 Tax=Geothrix limicola TaxID=2927978 RepID=UPI0025537547|nr:hypothetical protein [Geothrix limicola]
MKPLKSQTFFVAHGLIFCLDAGLMDFVPLIPELAGRAKAASVLERVILPCIRCWIFEQSIRICVFDGFIA